LKLYVSLSQRSLLGADCCQFFRNRPGLYKEDEQRIRVLFIIIATW